MSKTIAIFSVLALSVASVASAVSQRIQQAEDGAAAPATVHSSGPQTYRLGALGAGSCTVQRGAELSELDNRLEKDGDCEAVYPALASATAWRQFENGTIVLVDDRGRPVVEFSEADGEGFESVLPAAPFLTLVPADIL